MGQVLSKLDEEARRIDRQLGLRPPRTKATALPPPPPIEPPPADVEETGAEEAERRRLRRRRGRRETFITGDLMPEISKKRVLG